MVCYFFIIVNTGNFALAATVLRSHHNSTRINAGSIIPTENGENQLLSGSCSSVHSAYALDFPSLYLSLTLDRRWFLFFPSWPVYINYLGYHRLTRSTTMQWNIVFIIIQTQIPKTLSGLHTGFFYGGGTHISAASKESGGMLPQKFFCILC